MLELPSRRAFLRAVAVSIPVVAAARADDEKKVPDGLLHDRVSRALVADRVVGSYPLEVEVKDGEVTVKGWVAHPKELERIEKVVKKVKGVVKIDNQVRARFKD